MEGWVLYATKGANCDRAGKRKKRTGEQGEEKKKGKVTNNGTTGTRSQISRRGVKPGKKWGGRQGAVSCLGTPERSCSKPC